MDTRPLQLELSAWEMRLLMSALKRCADRDAEELHLKLSPYFGRDERYGATVAVIPREPQPSQRKPLCRPSE